MLRIVNLSLAVIASLFIASCGTGNSAGQPSGQTTTPKAVKTTTYVTMPGNTAIAVTLVDAIDTDIQVSGTAFRAQLSAPIVVEGHTLFADGAQAKGTLSKVVQSGHLKTPAEVNFSLTAIQNSDGKWINVGTNTIFEKKDSHTKNEVAMIGGGAIVGGIIGKLINKKNSTEIGAVAGAAAGVGAAAATGKKDIYHAIGTDVMFYSSQSTQIALN
jgi:hypothetical protein